MFRPFLSLAVAILAGGSVCSEAQEWTRFRGPNGSGLGQAPNLPAKFTEADFNWKVELPGYGHSSPVLWGDRIFISSAPKDTARRVVTCISAKDGSLGWKAEFSTGTFHQHPDNSFASSSPAVDAERVYFWWGAPEGSAIVALDQKDGREIWRKDLGPFVSQHGSGSSPIVVNDFVVLHFDEEQPGSFLAAFDAKTGAQRWKLPLDGTSSTASTPCLFQPKDGPAQLIVYSRTFGMKSVDPQKGTVLWDLPGLLSKRCVASPIVTPGGLVIAQCGEGTSESFVEAVKPASKGTPAAKVYEVVRVGGYVPTPIAVGDLLFLWKENGLVTCLRAADKQQLWSERVEGPFYGSPVCVNGKLYNMTRRGDLVVLGAGEKFEDIARIPLGEGSHATPAVAGGRMYLRTFTHLISVGK